MLPQQKEQRRQYGVPRYRGSYRYWKRNNAISWTGVKVSRKVEHPPLVPVTSKRGETHWEFLWD